MANKVDPVPVGYHSVTPYISVKGAAQALDFYKRAFGAEVLVRMDMPDGRVGHAEIKIGDSHVMLADEFPEMGFLSPQSVGGSPVMMHLYVEDVDAGKRAGEERSQNQSEECAGDSCRHCFAQKECADLPTR